MEVAGVVSHLTSLQNGEINPDGTPRCDIKVARAVGDHYGFTVSESLWDPLPTVKLELGGDGGVAPVPAQGETTPPVRLTPEQAGHLIAKRKGDMTVAELARRILAKGLIANKESSLTIGLYGLIGGTQRKDGSWICSLPVVKAAFAFFEIPEEKIPIEYLGKATKRSSTPAKKEDEAGEIGPIKPSHWTAFAMRLIEWAKAIGINTQGEIETRAEVTLGTISRLKAGQGCKKETALKLLDAVGKDGKNLPYCLRNGSGKVKDKQAAAAKSPPDAGVRVPENQAIPLSIADLLGQLGQRIEEALLLLSAPQPQTAAAPAPAAEDHRVAKLESRLDEANATNLSLRAELDTTKTRIDRTERDNSGLREDARKDQGTIERLRGELETAKTHAAQLDRDNTGLRRDAKKDQGTIEKLRREAQQSSGGETQPIGPINLTDKGRELCDYMRASKHVLEAISDPVRRELACQEIERTIKVVYNSTALLVKCREICEKKNK